MANVTIHKTISATLELDEDDIDILERILSHFIKETTFLPDGDEIVEGGRGFAKELLRELGDD